jgi:hypothetical protein
MRYPLITVLLSLAALTTRADDGIQSQPERVAVLEDKRLHESSGLALSQKEPDIFWTHNDSGSDPCIYAIDTKGITRAKVRLPGAVNFDWEDIASVKGHDGTARLFIGDLGDNLLVRPTITVYEIPEPTLPKNAGKEMLSTAPKVWHAHYPDGRHNAETLLVHPLTGRIHIVTKTDSGDCALYVFPAKHIDGSIVELMKLGDLKFPAKPRLGKRPTDASQTTGGAFSPDGRHVIISTYSYLHEWTLGVEEDLATALKRQAKIIEPPLVMQLESICYDRDGNTLWLTSERLPTPLWRIRR